MDGVESVAQPLGSGLARVVLANRPLLERLGELRNRLFRATVALAVACVVVWFFYTPILALLVQPLKSLPGASGVVSRGKLVFTGPAEAFSVRLRVVAFIGGALSSPVILWQLWQFVASGVKGRSTRYASVVVASAMILFLAGGAVAFLFVNPALHLFLWLGGSRVVLVPSAAEYLSFLMLLIVAFGLTFEYPLVLLALVLAGVMSSRQLRAKRRVAYFALIVVSAVVTPTVDPITPFALAIPLGLLYEGTILLSRAMKR